MLVPALLVSLWAFICHMDGATWQLGFDAPLFAGAITGLILGDFKQGMIIAAQLQMFWLGVVMIGAYVPPDTMTGAILGVAFGIFNNLDAMSAMAIAIPVAIVMQQMGILRMTLNIYIMHKADKDALTGDFDKAANNHLLGIVTLLLTGILPIFLAIYVGADYVAKLFEYIPPVIMNGLQVAGGFLPALGFGMLLVLMMDKVNWIFYILGFACTVFLDIPTMGVAVFALVLALLCDMLLKNPGGEEAVDNKDRRDL